MKVIALIFGVLAVLLGGLWLLQGMGLVRLEPVACLAECETLEDPSIAWAIIGFVVFLAGVLAILFALRPRVRK